MQDMTVQCLNVLHFIWRCNKLSTGHHGSWYALALRNIDSNYGHSLSNQFELTMASACLRIACLISWVIRTHCFTGEST